MIVQSNPSCGSSQRDVGIEAVRGIAALFVGLSHVFFLNLLTPGFPVPELLRNIEGGHCGVIMFFVLSGFVISWTNGGPCSRSAVRSYAWRRWMRLGPIYLMAMLLTLFAINMTGYRESPSVIAGSFLCLQNFNGYFGLALNPPRTNGPLWSLNYEVLYYALFVALWYRRPRLTWVFVPALIVAVLGWFAPRFMPLFIASYGSGWLFWAGGWWLANRPIVPDAKKANAQLATWVLLIFAEHRINGIARLLNVLGFYSNDSGMVNIADLGLAPGIFLVLSAVTHRRLPFKRWVEASAWLVCVVPLSVMICEGRLIGNPSWMVGAYALTLAALLTGLRSDGWLRPFAWFGSISYAFYVVHFPLLYIIGALPLPKATVFGFLERLALWLCATLSLSWFLEKRFQPWIKSRFVARTASPC